VDKCISDGSDLSYMHVRLFWVPKHQSEYDHVKYKENKGIILLGDHVTALKAKCTHPNLDKIMQLLKILEKWVNLGKSQLPKIGRNLAAQGRPPSMKQTSEKPLYYLEIILQTII
jgi:hypothetical protein